MQKEKIKKALKHGLKKLLFDLIMLTILGLILYYKYIK